MMKKVLLLLLFPLSAMAISNPPYEVYQYLAESSDNPPINYMKVCEPGRTGEENASYVVFWGGGPSQEHIRLLILILMET